MPRKLKVLAGTDIVDFCLKHGFKILTSKGSHVNLGVAHYGKAEHIITIPLHRELKRGTAHSIYKRLTRYMEIELLSVFFYTGDR